MSRRPSDHSLAPRHRPTQRRGRETVDRLLDATAQILERDGFEALTTNGIAAHAGVNVASLYKYFPNKYAVLSALAERNVERQREVVERAMDGMGDADDWRQLLGRGLDGFMEHLLTQPAFAELADAIRISPALRELEWAGIPAFVEMVAAQLRALGVPGGRKDVDAMARVIVESSAAVLMGARLLTPAERKRSLAELRRMLVRYLEPVLG